MRWQANIGEGLRAVLRHPLRSLLTAITSAVAIAVTVNVISLSYGMEDDVRRGIMHFGVRTLDVARLPILLPGAKRPTLGPAELERIRTMLKDFDPVLVPRRQIATQIEGGALCEHVPLVCVGQDYPATLDVGFRSGTWWKTGDKDVAVIDGALEVQLFPDGGEATGRTIQVRLDNTSRSVRIVGVMEDPLPYRELFETFDSGRSSRTLTASLLSFRNCYMPLDTLSTTDDAFSGISVVARVDADIDPIHDRLKTVWQAAGDSPLAMLASGVGVFVRRKWMSVLGSNTRRGADAGNIVWILIVVVAAIMISTLHLISVRERYDELAIRRCEGARKRDVALQITAEGVITSLAGGLLGLPLGYAGAAVLRQIVDFPFRFEFKYAVIATLVAAGLGLIAAVIPARHVARLQPARVLTRRLR